MIFLGTYFCVVKRDFLGWLVETYKTWHVTVIVRMHYLFYLLRKCLLLFLAQNLTHASPVLRQMGYRRSSISTHPAEHIHTLSSLVILIYQMDFAIVFPKRFGRQHYIVYVLIFTLLKFITRSTSLICFLNEEIFVERLSFSEFCSELIRPFFDPVKVLSQCEGLCLESLKVLAFSEITMIPSRQLSWLLHVSNFILRKKVEPSCCDH